MHHKNLLIEKIKESLNSVLPITLIVAALGFILVPVESGLMLAFIIGSTMLVIGMGLFNLGAEISMSKIGNHIGAKITASKKLWIVLLISFLIGAFVTMAEPDLQVLAKSVPDIDTGVLIATVSVGVGIFLLICMLRILFKIPLRIILTACYFIVLILAFFVPKEMLPVAFDSGGVTTGPMTVPFIMALGIGVASVRSDENAKADGFGLVGLSSIGPIISVMILGRIYNTESTHTAASIPVDYGTTVALGSEYIKALPTYLMEVAIALLPIFAFFVIFQIVSLKLRKIPLLKILIGIAYTYVGLVIFLTGVNVGFSPLGSVLGNYLVSGGMRYFLIPLGMLMGWFIINAEPAVHILNKQVEELSAGAISEKTMGLSLSIAVAVANGLAMVRVITGLPIQWFLIPGYVIAIGLSFMVPKTFTAIAFDSGGVASGPLTATFMLPFAMGACAALDGNIMTDAFGLVAMVAMTPLITVQVMGAISVIKGSRKKAVTAVYEFGDNEVIELWEVA